MYKRYRKVLWKYLWGTIRGFFIVPFLYRNRVKLRAEQKMPWWYYMNNTEPEHPRDVDWRDGQHI